MTTGSSTTAAIVGANDADGMGGTNGNVYHNGGVGNLSGNYVVGGVGGRSSEGDEAVNAVVGETVADGSDITVAPPVAMAARAARELMDLIR